MAAALERALGPAAGCARLDFRLGGAGAVVLTGFAEAPEVVDRAAVAVRAVDGVAAVNAGGVAVYPQPFCAALAVLDRASAQPDPPAGIALRPNRADAVYREGDFFSVTVGMPETRPGYLYVDYLDKGGNVVHLVPSPFVRDNRYGPGASVTLGARDADQARTTGMRSYQVTPPFGESLIVAVVTPEPLFDDIREEVEAAEAYLPVLAERLEQIDDGADAAPLGAARFLEIMPQQE